MGNENILQYVSVTACDREKSSADFQKYTKRRLPGETHALQILTQRSVKSANTEADTAMETITQGLLRSLVEGAHWLVITAFILRDLPFTWGCTPPEAKYTAHTTTRMV
jgi:hypothetical protein